jgi:diacylglycerol kinase family enzyme
VRVTDREPGHEAASERPERTNHPEGTERQESTDHAGRAVAPRGTADAATRPTVGERASAVGALASLVAAVGFSLFGIALHLLAILIVAAGLLICVTSGWYVVSRRGVRRVIALTVAGLALAGTIAGLFFADINWPLLLLIAALAGLSVLAARHALRRTRRALRSRAMQGKRAHHARHPVLIMNPKSGGGKAERFHLADECRRRGIRPVLLTPGDDLRQLAEDAVARGADAIGMAGGDGSQALVASVAAQAGIPYVCVPAGTRNHFALDLGLNRDDVVGALDAFSDGVEHQIDLATVNGRTFVNNASLGLYAKVVQSPEYRDAKLRTAAAMLPDLLGPAADPLDLCFTGPGGEEHHTAQLILISNNPYQLVPMEGGAGTRERLDTGLLGIVAVKISDAAGADAFFALQALGQASRYTGWMEWAAPRFEITSAAEVEIGVDGEALRMTSPVVFEIQPGALRVRLPRHALRRSPAARTVHVLSRSTVSELARVAGGSNPG